MRMRMRMKNVGLLKKKKKKEKIQKTENRKNGRKQVNPVRNYIFTRYISFQDYLDSKIRET